MGSDAIFLISNVRIELDCRVPGQCLVGISHGRNSGTWPHLICRGAGKGTLKAQKEKEIM